MSVIFLGSWEWIGAWEKQIVLVANRFLDDLFALHSHIFSDESRKKKTLIPYIYNASNADPF